MKKQSLKDRVVAFLKGGDEAKLSKFEAKLGKEYARQISAKEDQIEKLQEKVEDATELLNEAVLNVDLARINNSDSSESYVATYMRIIREKRNAVKTLQQQIEDVQLEIAELEADKAAIYGVEEK